MDCDGRRQLLITDIDGTFSGGKAGDTIISKAEFEWGGNPSFGLGMFHFATTVSHLSSPSGASSLRRERAINQYYIIYGYTIQCTNGVDLLKLTTIHTF